VLILHADSPFASRSLRRFDIDGYDSLLIADRFGDSQPIPKGMTFDDDYIPGGVESNLIETGKIRFDSDKAEPGWQGHDAGYSTDPKVVIFPGAKLFDKRKPFGATEKDEPDKDFLRRVTEDL
jgi:hypothetical protein